MAKSLRDVMRNRKVVAGVALTVVAGAIGAVFYTSEESGSASAPSSVPGALSQVLQQAAGPSPSPRIIPVAQMGDSLLVEKQVVSDQVIISFKPRSDLASLAEKEGGLEKVAAEMSRRLGMQVTYSSSVSDFDHVFRMARRPASEAEMNSILNKIQGMKGVDKVFEDKLFFPTMDANDNLYADQWHLRPTTADRSVSGINAPAAWDKTTGREGAVIAVIDTGITAHSDLAAKTLPGFDFVADAAHAGDGDGRDADPSDMGDFVTAEEAADTAGPFYGCPSVRSSWHGTHVAGIAAATANNSVGVAGIDWRAKILPVRVLGKCGGYMSDITTGVRWAAGLAVRGVPLNPNPAQVINMSLGVKAICFPLMQVAILEAVKTGALVVTAAGNSNNDVSLYAPSNCLGALSVAATHKGGDKAWYSNFGRGIRVAAPGGDLRQDPVKGGILSTLNDGLTVPGSEAYAWYQGTSMAAPVASGVASLVLASNDRLRGGEAGDILIKTAVPFPEGTGCQASAACGAGLINANEAIKTALETKPDLRVEQLSFPYAYWIPGQPIGGTIKIANAGKLRVREEVVLKTYLSTDATLDSSDRLVSDDAILLDIAPGRTQQMPIRVEVPRNLNGQHYVITKINPEGAIPELSGDNNVKASNSVIFDTPVFKIASVQYTQEVPARVKLTMAPTNPSLARLVNDASWRYDWTIPDGVTVVSTEKHVSSIVLNTPGVHQVSVEVTNEPRELVRSASAELTGIEAPPFVVTLKTRSSNVYMREPVDVTLEPVITGGHPEDRVLTYSYNLDGGAATSIKPAPMFPALAAGDHNVALAAKTKFGLDVTAAKQLVVSANKLPTCTLTSTNSLAYKRLTFISKCADPDGRIRRYEWAVNGELVSATGDRFVRDYTGTGSMEVTVKATDDSGGSVTATHTATY